MLGAVLYTDGGAINNPGPFGAGVHGYIFEFKHPKKGTGNHKYTLTQHGYLTNEEFVVAAAGKNGKKKDLQKEIKNIPDDASPEFIQEAFELPHPYEVTPIRYLDGLQGFSEYGTNNQAELYAAILGISSIFTQKHVQGFESLQYLKIISDSEYLVKGFNEYLPTWKEQNYVRKGGKEIANLDLWKRLADIGDQCKESGIQLKIEWIKGHNGFFGNERADHYATIGINLSIQECLVVKSDRHLIMLNEAQGYWKADLERPELFFNRYVLFNTGDWKEPNHFFTCTTSEPLRFLGNKQSDAGFSLIHLTPDPEESPKEDSVTEMESINIINEIIDKQCKVVEHVPLIAALQLDVIFKPGFINDFRLIGQHAMKVSSDHKRELLTSDKEALAENVSCVINPPYISWRVEDIMDRMVEMLDRKKENDPILVSTDITDLLYDTVEKKVKKETITVRQLKPKFKVGYLRESVMARYNTMENNSIEESKVTLRLGQDIPDRNTLKRIEESVISVEVLTLALIPNVFCYGVYITTKKGSILSTGYYSSVHILSNQKPET